jgi:hypothetical protein
MYFVSCIGKLLKNSPESTYFKLWKMYENCNVASPELSYGYNFCPKKLQFGVEMDEWITYIIMQHGGCRV